MNDHHSHHQESLKLKKRSKLLLFLGLSGLLSIVIFFIEAIGSQESGSLALFADAGHIATDIFAHLISLLAVYFSAKKANDRFPFGYYRVEVIAALFNSLLLVCIGFFILYEAYVRMLHQVPVEPHSMLTYSLAGLVVNIISALLLSQVSQDSLNVKSTYYHVLSDLLGTVAVVIGAIIIQNTGYLLVDSILSLCLGIFIVRSSYLLLKESIQILLEASPKDFERDHFLNHLRETKHVIDIPSIKIRKLTSGVFTAELQIVVEKDADRDKVILEIHKMAKTHFGIPYVFVECIGDGLAEHLSQILVKELDLSHNHHGHHHH
ncbi:cation diffusion facilitator family transporter [Leptospira ryugenii]|uniref:Cation diffusion facilitator family transporter n=1 Tax=Leptospira ryugenii TaxID=1917863 RepID=A0A2P2DX67_9LEPT|nr:cation diffusion facilitator family transporter [Leptospira ryugenii]GBF49223.1 cation diffusion facilitator family transporter [Leptospira ryugenii]